MFGDDLTSPLALAASAVGMSGGAAGIGGAVRRARRWSVEETWVVRRPTLALLGWGGALLGALSLGTVGEALGTAWWDLLSERFGLELSTDALAAIAEGLLAGAISHRAIFAVVVVLIGPILEELVFRGFLWRLLRGDERPWIALIGTSLLFAGWHMDPIQSVGVLPLAVFLGTPPLAERESHPRRGRARPEQRHRPHDDPLGYGCAHQPPMADRGGRRGDRRVCAHRPAVGDQLDCLGSREAGAPSYLGSREAGAPS